MPYRILTYSHDSCGLGHLRRTLLIGQRLLEALPGVSILSVIGSPSDHCFPRAHRRGLDLLKLPCVEKTISGAFQPRFLEGPLNILMSLRRKILTETIKDYRPDLVIVDKWPAGMMGELQPALDWCGETAASTKWVLSLRDILDQPENVIREWENSRCYQTLEQHYSEIWVFGQQDICRVPEEYAFPPALVEKTTFLGYLTPSQQDDLDNDTSWNEDRQESPLSPSLLVTTGGGADGHFLVEHVLRAYAAYEGPEIRLEIVTGPMMPDERRAALGRLVQRHPRVEMFDYTTHMSRFISQSHGVISMGGYNTLREVIYQGKPLLVIPRVNPRQEQLIRAMAFAKLGLCRVAHPEENPAPAIQRFFEDVVSGNAHSSANSLQFGAENMLCARVRSLLSGCEAEPNTDHERAAV